jgi:hypothetical protein
LLCGRLPDEFTTAATSSDIMIRTLPRHYNIVRVFSSFGCTLPTDIQQALIACRIEPDFVYSLLFSSYPLLHAMVHLLQCIDIWTIVMCDYGTMFFYVKRLM